MADDRENYGIWMIIGFSRFLINAKKVDGTKN
jgi:hypothetical protein